jgi:uncharacterized protein
MCKMVSSVLLLVVALCAGCHEQVAPKPAQAAASLADPNEIRHAQPKLPTMMLWLGAEQLNTELALTQKQEMTGMMFRTNMAENEAMLFVFPEPQQVAFWMKNTLLPLSAAYIDPDGVIQEIHKLQPLDTNSVVAASDQIQFVLETKQGWFKRHHIGVGTVVRTERGSLRQTFFGRSNE